MGTQHHIYYYADPLNRADLRLKRYYRWRWDLVFSGGVLQASSICFIWSASVGY